ncbi:MAG: redoxin family protein [Prevotellaceae bacterium]|nr:redoxin family protein [Prevotellaceae bacterium]
MRKFILAVLATMLCYTSAIAGEKKVVWEKPNVVMNESASRGFTIKKVVFTEDETVLHLHKQYFPKYWIKFVEETVLRDENGKIYPALNGQAVEADETDLELGKEFWMPESGEVDIALHFSPLPIDTKVFDLIEGNEEGAFMFWNISDSKGKYKPALPAEWKNVKYAKNEVMPEAKLNRGMAKVHLKVLGYKPDMKFSLFVVGRQYPVSNEQSITEIPLSSTGEATAEIPVEMAQLAYVGIQNVYVTGVMLAPNETVECLMDLNAPEDNRFVAFKGYMAKTDMDLFSSIDLLKFEGFEKMMYDGLSVCNTPEERLAFLDKRLEETKKKVNALNVTDAAKAILRMAAEEEYIDWRKDWKLNYTNAEIVVGVRKHETREDWMKAMDENKKMMPEWRPDSKTDYFELLGEPYSPCCEKFWEIDPQTYRYSDEEWDIATFLDKNGNPAKYNHDLRLAHTLIVLDDTNAFAQGIDKIGSEDCKEIVREHFAELKRKTEEAKANSHMHYQEFDDVAPENILNTILERHPNKIVVLDLWATWCGPCREGHKDMAPMKEELKDEPVDFVYLTYNTSPLNTWMAMISDIPGDHYYLTKEQLRYLLEQYHSDGFPTYAIYNKDKQQTFVEVGYPGSKKMREEIDKAMK